MCNCHTYASLACMRHQRPCIMPSNNSQHAEHAHLSGAPCASAVTIYTTHNRVTSNTRVVDPGDAAGGGRVCCWVVAMDGVWLRMGECWCGGRE
eukprot:2871447-Amphidinium_carterae.1